MHLRLGPPVEAFHVSGGEPHGGSRSELRNRRPLCTVQLSDIKPLLLPNLDGLDEGPLGPCGIGQLAYHGPAAVCVLPVDHLRLRMKDFQPWAEVWGHAEKSLTHDDKRRDVEERNRG